MNELDCKDIKALLSGILDDELDVQTRHLAERHIADCAGCRALLNEAESLNHLLTLDSQRALWPAGLPAGFENAVLRQTIYAEAYEFAGRRWTSWSGWIAAAACVLLAGTLWLLDASRTSSRQATGENVRRPASVAHQISRSSSYTVSGHSGTSWTHDGGLPVDFSLASSRRTLSLSDDDVQAIDDQLVNVMPASFSRPWEEEPISDMTLTDVDTLYATSNLLDMLKSANMQTFSDVERVRQIAEYDDILPRLADSRERLQPADLPAVLAAESVLARVVNGPISLDDLEVLQNTVSSLELPAQIDRITHRSGALSSL